MATNSSNGDHQKATKQPPLRFSKFFQKSNMLYQKPVRLQPKHKNMCTHGVRSCYDEGKRVAETLMFDYHRQHGIEIRIARIFNTYGPRMNIDDGRCCQQLHCSSDTWGTLNSPSSRNSNSQFLLSLRHGIHEHVSHWCFVIAIHILELINPAVEIKMIENTPDDPRQRKLDITQAKELLGWEPKVKLRDGLPLMEDDILHRLGVGKKN